MSKYIKYILVSGLVIFSITCKKDNEVIKSDDHINVLIGNDEFKVKNSYWTNMHFDYMQFAHNYNQYGFYYGLDSNSFIKISFGIVHKSTDYNLEKQCLKLKNEIFYETFKPGNCDFFPTCYVSELEYYDTGAIVEYQTREKSYSPYKRDDYKCSISSDYNFKIKQIEIVNKNLDWSDCEHSHRILRIEGSFECYVYYHHNDDNQTDSLKLTCDDFVGTIQN
jgi:hypothetical protein